MSSTQRIKTVAGTLVVGVLLTGSFAATGLAGTGVSKAVQARAKATNQFYGLGTVDSKAVRARAQAMNGFYGSGAAAALKAEKLRSAALNRYYGLGVDGKQVQRAEQRRSQAINQAYDLGQYAVISGSSSFDWADAGIGAGGMLGTLLVASGLAIVARRRFSSPSTT